MGNIIQEIFNPTPEQIKKQEEFIQKLTQDMIDRHDCFYCKHAALKEHWEHGKYSGRDAWCQVDGRDEYEGLIDKKQMCLFWEYSDPEERYVE